MFVSLLRRLRHVLLGYLGFKIFSLVLTRFAGRFFAHPFSMLITFIFSFLATFRRVLLIFLLLSVNSAQRARPICNSAVQHTAKVQEQGMVMNVIEGRQGTQEEANKVRDRVVATVEERWKAGGLKGQLRPGVNWVVGVHTEDGTRGTHWGAAGGEGFGRGRRIQGDSVEGGKGWSRLQEDKGVLGGERQKSRNLVHEEEGVRGDVGERRTRLREGCRARRQQ